MDHRGRPSAVRISEEAAGSVETPVTDGHQQPVACSTPKEETQKVSPVH